MPSPKECASREDVASGVAKEVDPSRKLDPLCHLKEGEDNAVSDVPRALSDGDVSASDKGEGNAGQGYKSTTDGTHAMEEVPDGLIVDPKVGMVFRSEEQAFQFYNSYAKRKGFSVRKGHLSRRKDGSVRDRHYLCSNEGTRKEHRTHVTKKPRALERTNCLARIEFKVNRNDTWVVNKFVDEHNHPLASPNKIHMLRSHRKKLHVQRAFITEMDYVGVKPSEGCDAEAEDARDTETEFLLKNQSYYLLHANRTRDLEKGDAQFLLEFFKTKQLEDPSFFYAVQVDEKDRLTNFFWTDARSIFDYTCFGDVILLDTTYRASRYDIPFAPIVGVNHHKQMVIFGAALLLDETMESFLWLFKTFMTAVSGRQPRTILTDNCDSLSKAISMTLPGTHHQFCLWHIFQNTPKVVPHVYGHESNFQTEFGNWLYESRSEDDLQKGWETLLTTYSLQGNTWFEDLYAAREKWSLVYCRDSFCATMATRQWCEAMGNRFKILFYRKLPPTKFMVQYHQAVLQLREKELAEDCESRQAKLVPLADIPMLIEASEAYTRTVYREFEDEYKCQLACLCEPVSINGTNYTFRVSSSQKRSYGLVEYDPSNILVTCSCKKFEKEGILCMHALKVLNYNNILYLPSCYILKRWTKYAKDEAGSDRGRPTNNSPGQESLALRYSQVCRKAITLAAKCAFSKDALQLVERGLDRFMAQMVYELHNDPSSKQADNMNLVHSMQQSTIEAANICFDGF